MLITFFGVVNEGFGPAVGRLIFFSSFKRLGGCSFGGATNWVNFCGVYLEDHPRTCKWLITMVSFSPLTGAMFPFQLAFLWLINRGY